MPRTQLKRAAFAAFLKSGEVRDFLSPRAERVLAAAKASAPRDSGEYANDLHIEQATTDRAVVRVVSTVRHGAVVESRTGNLARALDAAGGS